MRQSNQGCYLAGCIPCQLPPFTSYTLSCRGAPSRKRVIPWVLEETAKGAVDCFDTFRKSVTLDQSYAWVKGSIDTAYFCCLFQSRCRPIQVMFERADMRDEDKAGLVCEPVTKFECELFCDQQGNRRSEFYEPGILSPWNCSSEIATSTTHIEQKCSGHC